MISENPLSSRLSLCIFVPETKILHSLTELLSGDRYDLHILNSATDLAGFVSNNKENLDCLIILKSDVSIPIINEFYEQGLILPVIILEPNNLETIPSDITAQETPSFPLELTLDSTKENHTYHTAEVTLTLNHLNHINHYIDKAITQFLHLAPSCSINENPTNLQRHKKIEEKQNFLLLQQRRLAEKLKERLGYLGVYYKRNPSYFYRHLSQTEKEELIAQMSAQYREIILDYFKTESEVNQAIDQFVTQAFFADLSVSQILEIHMELMDEFAQQLKLEGRSEDILLDYRLALIDIIAHLCEMYRRSIPKEDLPFDVLFTVD